MSKNRRAQYALFLGVCAVLLSSCAGGVFKDVRLDRALALGQSGSLLPKWMQAGSFVLLAQTRATDPSAPLRVYIEGDGFAYSEPGRAALDPSPRVPVALELAALDTAPNVAWLARPCQYVLLAKKQTTCNSAFWTNRRMASEVVSALDTAVSALKRATGAQALELVGYSGGGAAAVLLAARRKDVVCVRTVAGNLDNAAFTRHHGVDSMPESLDAKDVAALVRAVPQRHFVGENDTVVPPTLASAFLLAVGERAKIVRVHGADHENGWRERWPDLLARSCVEAPKE